MVTVHTAILGRYPELRFKYATGVLAPDRTAALAAFHCAVVASAGGYTSVGDCHPPLSKVSCLPPIEAGDTPLRL